jgi:transposase
LYNRDGGVKMERRQYDREFKIDAVKLSMQEGKKVIEVAAGLGIHENLLYQWRRLYNRGLKPSVK